MRTQNVSWKRLTVVTWLILAVALVATVAVTQLRAHGGDPDVIHACVNSSSGEVKIVGPDDECKKNWTAIDWGIQGPAGPVGPPGLQGEPGSPGSGSDVTVACDVAAQLANLLPDFQVPPDCDGPPPRPPPPLVFNLGHFQCYNAFGPSPDAFVELEDQFGWSPGVVLDAQSFCNPVEKTHAGNVTEIHDWNAHLTLYALQLDPTLPSEHPAQVSVGNQFGTNQVLQVFDPVLLAVPTQKDSVTTVVDGTIDTGLGFPDGLDHFKCYQVAGEGDGWTVGLVDQFTGIPNVAVLDPRLLCNPVAKFHFDPNDPTGGQTTGVQNWEEHLVCYEVLPEAEFFANVSIQNQFGPDQVLEVSEASGLCLPSTKTVVAPPPPPPPPTTDAGRIALCLLRGVLQLW